MSTFSVDGEVTYSSGNAREADRGKHPRMDAGTLTLDTLNCPIYENLKDMSR